MLKGRLPDWIQRNIPDLPEVGTKEKLRACTGTMIGILITALVSHFLISNELAQFWLLAPMGASAIILFTFPSSPLAQPWSFLGGNLISAFVGITCVHFIVNPVICACIAIFIALTLMFALRCLHPPSGAVALITILGGDWIKDLGYMFIITPLAINTVLMLASAVIYNKLSGQRYPFPKSRPNTTESQSPLNSKESSSSLISKDLKTALTHSNELIDVDLGVLEELFLQTERIAFNRRTGSLQCQHIMNKNVTQLEFATHLSEAWQIIKQRNVQALPVVTKGGQLMGIVTRSDFLKQIETNDYISFTKKLKALLKKNSSSTSNRPEVVGQIMRTHTKTVLNTSPMVEVIPLMLEQKMRHVAVVNTQGIFVGMINQTDMIAGLYQNSISKASPQ